MGCHLFAWPSGFIRLDGPRRHERRVVVVACNNTDTTQRAGCGPHVTTAAAGSVASPQSKSKKQKQQPPGRRPLAEDVCLSAEHGEEEGSARIKVSRISVPMGSREQEGGRGGLRTATKIIIGVCGTIWGMRWSGVEKEAGDRIWRVGWEWLGGSAKKGRPLHNQTSDGLRSCDHAHRMATRSNVREEDAAVVVGLAARARARRSTSRGSSSDSCRALCDQPVSTEVMVGEKSPRSGSTAYVSCGGGVHVRFVQLIDALRQRGRHVSRPSDAVDVGAAGDPESFALLCVCVRRMAACVFCYVAVSYSGGRGGRVQRGKGHPVSYSYSARGTHTHRLLLLLRLRSNNLRRDAIDPIAATGHGQASLTGTQFFFFEKLTGTQLRKKNKHHHHARPGPARASPISPIAQAPPLINSPPPHRNSQFTTTTSAHRLLRSSSPRTVIFSHHDQTPPPATASAPPQLLLLFFFFFFPSLTHPTLHAQTAAPAAPRQERPSSPRAALRGTHSNPSHPTTPSTSAAAASSASREMGDAPPPPPPPGGTTKSYFDVLGICCPSEVPLVERLLSPLPGVTKVTVIVPSRPSSSSTTPKPPPRRR
ncbi:hypothetical protein HU200_043212 [Digitaria exilis]|uniref:HMA domain-containing protein n=1 Tax=Digitaria exilis TaxID=1010633 RepID=A0A835EI17_9POAL|nr:hypothetical protein HU200_043212 [Digitaria exilis]